ncbi:MAG: flagellar basal body rod protein FlgC [Firmicutes bacterium]|nr:flagellar basal body rod protein FlgC [Bacillota bacterium]
MSFLNSLNIVASGLTAQQQRLDVISENITNSATTRTEQGGAYRRKMVVFEAQNSGASFRSAMNKAMQKAQPLQGGVKVTAIVEDPTDFQQVYDPTHPDADENGFVDMPNVDTVKEITDAMAATQAYSADVTALNTLKSVISKGLEIGR